MRMPGSRSTCWPNYSITETSTLSAVLEEEQHLDVPVIGRHPWLNTMG
jgi:hypothetical protein